MKISSYTHNTQMKINCLENGIIPRDSNGIEINQNDIIHIHIEFRNFQEFTGKFLSLDVDQMDGDTFGTYFIQNSDDDIIDIDVDLNNDLTPLVNDHYKVIITNLSYELEQQNIFSPY